MAHPAQAIVVELVRLRSRFFRRRMQDDEPAAPPPLPAVDPKRRMIYFDKARWPRRDYEDKGVPPHG